MSEIILDKQNKSCPTLCWNCANAIGKCPWSAEFKPVNGWKIIETVKESCGKSCIVLECPMFKRDAAYNGTVRYKEEGGNSETEMVKR